MANKIKIQRLESQILNIINRTIVLEVNDRIAKLGRITYVKLSNELSILKAYVDCQDRNKIPKVVEALNKISGLFRSKIASSISTYKSPRIIFEIDKTIDYAKNIDKIIRKLHEEK